MKPVVVALVAFLLLGGRAEAGKGGFSSGGSKPAASSPRVSTPKPSFPRAASPSKPTAGGFSAGPSGKPTPAAPKFDALAAADAKKAASRAAYARSEAPANSYKTTAGTAKPIKPDDPKAARVRETPREKWVDRDARETTFYRSYSTRPVVVYHDPYHPYLGMYLMDRSVDLTALWLYHHSASVDAARREALYAQNAALRGKVAALEAQGVTPDPAWVPPDTDADLMYDRGFVDAAYNPAEPPTRFWYYVGWVVRWLVLFPILLLSVAGLLLYVYHLLFVQKF